MAGRMIASTGLPDSIFTSIDQFDDFLSRGCVDTGNVRVEAFTASQYDALVTLTESYFAAGYEWFSPAALRAAEQDNQAMRFSGTEM